MKHTHTILTTLVLVFATALLTGCNSRSRSARPDYETISDPINRNTELALRENARAMALYEEGKLDEAEASLRSALKADVMFGPAHNNLGKVYFEQKKYYLAAWEFEYAAKLMPHRSEPRSNLGLVFEAVGRLDDAVVAYTQALEIGPENTKAIGNLARARVRRGDRDDEVHELLQAVVMKDDRPEWVAWARDQLHLIGFKPSEQ